MVNGLNKAILDRYIIKPTIVLDGISRCLGSVADSISGAIQHHMIRADGEAGVGSKDVLIQTGCFGGVATADEDGKISAFGSIIIIACVVGDKGDIVDTIRLPRD